MCYFKKNRITLDYTRLYAMVTTLFAALLLKSCQLQRKTLAVAPVKQQEATEERGSQSLSARALVTPIHDHTFTASSGQKVRFSQEGGVWQAVLQVAPSDYVPQHTLSVVGSSDINTLLSSIQQQDECASKSHIHITSAPVFPYKPCVYLGKYGLLGGGGTKKKKKDKKQKKQTQAVVLPVAEDTPETVRKKEELEAKKQALVRSKQTHQDAPHSELAHALNHVGEAYIVLGDFHQGLQYCEQALEMYQVLYLDEEVSVQSDLVHLLDQIGRTYITMGDADKGLAYREQGISLCKKMHQGQPHSEVAYLLDEVYSDCASIGILHKALSYAQQAVTVRRLLHEDGMHPTLARSLNNLGQAHVALGKPTEGLVYFEEALAMMRTIHKNEPHHDLADTLDSVGSVYNMLGELRIALDYFTESLAIKENLYEDQNHTELANALDNVGKVYKDLGEPHNALEFFEQALAMRQEIYGDENHDHLITSFDHMGMAYEQLGETEKALDYFEKSIAMYRVLYPDEPHIGLAGLLNNAGLVHQDMGRLDKSLTYKKEALAIYQTIYKEQPSPYVTSSLYNVGNAYYKLGNLEEALVYYEQVLKTRQELSKIVSDPDIAMSLNTIGQAYYKFGEIEKAVKCYEEALHLIPSEGYYSLRCDFYRNLGRTYQMVSSNTDIPNQRQVYADKTMLAFKLAVAASDMPGLGLLTEYANFLLYQKQYQQAYTSLNQAIASQDRNGELVYNSIDRSIVVPLLKEHILKNTVVEIRALDYAYYLLLYHYKNFEKAGITLEKSRYAYLEEYTRSVASLAGQPGKEKQDELARIFLDDIAASLCVAG